MSYLEVPNIVLYDEYQRPVLTGITICAKCGAAVAHQELHDAFHAALAAQRRKTR